MSVKLTIAVAFAAGTLLMAGNASAQFGPQVTVSNPITGSPNIPQGVSAGRCGNNIVVGFGDMETSTPSGSSAGFSVSKDGGKTFSDLGALADPTLSFGGGDSSVIGCSSGSKFYYATLGLFSTPDGGSCVIGCTEVALSTSTNSGSTWGAPVAASAGTSDIYNFDSAAFAVDPSNPLRLYIAYINHNTNIPEFPCDSTGTDDILEIVTSVDGGRTWNGRSDPAIIAPANIKVDNACSDPGSQDARHSGSLKAPSVVVSPVGHVYVTWEFSGKTDFGPGAPNEIRFAVSTNGGQTFSAPSTVSTDAIDDARPELAVDRTTSSSRGTIYLLWSGQPRSTTTEVLVSDSLNQGLSFSFPRSVRSTSQGTQIDPVVAVDMDGEVAACFYVASTDTPTSTSHYFYSCLTSFNHAATWAQFQKLVTVAPPGFDALTGDVLLKNDGFFTAFELTNSGQRHVVGEKSK